MAMFLAEISFLLTLALFAAGLLLWQRGGEGTSALPRVAGAVLVVGTLLTALCNGYFSVRYHVQGEFQRAYPLEARMPAGAMLGPGCAQAGGMHPGMMRHGMMRQMGPGTMPHAGQSMPVPGGPPEAGAPSGDEQHHAQGQDE